MTNPIIRRAVISVSNKTGLIPFAQQLFASGVELIATGGTATLLINHDIPVTTVSDYTGFPEIMGGRVKTLHPKIYAGLLQRPELDEVTLQDHQIDPIDLLIVNLYPFQATIAKTNCTFEQAIENIDIGGPAMLRAGAKNYHSVTVVVDPEDYHIVLAEIQKNGFTCLSTRRHLAKKAFAHTAQYDSAIYAYLAQDSLLPQNSLPDLFQPLFQKKMDLRYGENPHQMAALYTDLPSTPHTLADAKLLQGKPLSFNNLLDSNAALNCVLSLDSRRPACVIVKHETPCGVAQADTLLEAYQKALATDPTSAFGGIIAINCPLDVETAKAMLSQQFVEVLLIPQIKAEAFEMLQTKPQWRILISDSILSTASKLNLRSIDGGILVQQQDYDDMDEKHLQIVTHRKPSPAEMKDLLFAWKVVQFVKSNAIVYAKNLTTLGIGTGQTSRVFSAQIAILKAKQADLSLMDACMASDAFFPFADGIEVAAAAGVRSIIQPGGSKRDEETIAAANRYDIAMVFTGVRHFRH